MASATTCDGTSRPRPFGVERFFAKYEFTLRHHLSNSDCETIKIKDMLAMADPECRQLWDELDAGYTESCGHPKLLEQLRQYYAPVLAHNQAALAPGSELTTDILTCVPLEGIVMVMNAFLDAGDSVIVMAPCYQALSEIARSRRCNIVFWEAKKNSATNLFEFHTDDLETLFTRAPSKVKLLVMNTPHNPTGADFYGESHESEAIAKIRKLCTAHKTIIFSDEMYGRIMDDVEVGVVRDTKRRKLDDRAETADAASNDTTSVFHSWAGYPNAIVLSGLSKAEGLPGLRVGWLVCTADGVHERLFEKLCEQKDYLTICGSGPSEILALIALRNQNAILSRNRQLVRANMKALMSFCDNSGVGWFDCPRFSMRADDDGKKTCAIPLCTVFLTLGPKALSRYATADAFAAALIERFGICIVPGSKFYDPDFGEKLPEEGMRFGLGRKAFQDTLDVLGKALRQLESE
eukprot:TRINITY_DN5901_c1_g2_i1.p1 TRINITY_DN5901_c1_g2~~TRINITY_DN5901_c1_g2_i1.p1  ORF type:complete len:464 (+),score=57.73 TRINITY_DN5901_c1_g2_i1:64-1455(+)